LAARQPDREPGGGAWRTARLVVALRWPIVLAWIAAAALLTVLLPAIREAQVGALGDLVPTEADALEAELRSHRLFRFPLLSRTVIVQRDPSGLSLAEHRRVVENAVGINDQAFPGLTGVAGALAVTNALGAPPFSRERSTTAITYLFIPPDIGPVGRMGLAERFVERRVEPFHGFVGVTGAVAARQHQGEAVAEALPIVELATVVLIALAVGLHFRAIGAPVLNLVAAAAGYLVSVRLIAWTGRQLEVSVPAEVEPMIVVLILGLGTDWSIFFLSRFRRRLAEGDGGRVAAERATAELLPIIVTAGLTVIGASGALAVAELGFLRAFGPGMAMAVLIALVAAITLVPALLAIGGEAIFWPKRPSRGASAEPATEGYGEPERRRGRRGRARAVRLASNHPILTTAACLLILLVAASGTLRLDLGNPLIRGLPPEAEARQAYRQASQGFAPGILAPTVLVVEDPGIVRRRRELERLQRRLERHPGVAEAVGPGDQPLGSPLGAALSRTGDAARFLLILRSDPLGSAAIADLRSLQARLPELLDRVGLGAARASFAGDTALVAETIEETTDDLRQTGPVVVSVVFVILAVFLRALVAPLYLVAASVLALLASLGLATYFFQSLLGFGDLTYYVPFAAAVLLVALGSDYSVFLAGRIWQEARTRPIGEAVVVGGSRAATPITVAGLVLAASFALLALVPIRPFRELAFTMGVGLLIDAFLVRTLLVPAMISLAGARSGWPGRRLKEKRPAARHREAGAAAR
ncbi:MAG: MMPL family transporter, partial [Actinomycetota bacterium]|nr:MMPL family transporter [Actinomycetota bacterium]